MFHGKNNKQKRKLAIEDVLLLKANEISSSCFWQYWRNSSFDFFLLFFLTWPPHVPPRASSECPSRRSSRLAGLVCRNGCDASRRRRPSILHCDSESPCSAWNYRTTTRHSPVASPFPFLLTTMSGSLNSFKNQLSSTKSNVLTEEKWRSFFMRPSRREHFLRTVGFEFRHLPVFLPQA